jgi:LDH2 family malate/lactate/ureidoglycolate dehydrogenase
MMVTNETRIEPQLLMAYLSALFSRTGMNEEDASFCAEALVQTNLWGVDSHGVLRAPIYVNRVASGAVNPNPQIRTIRGGAALEVLDGDDGMGFIVGRAAMRRAIYLAEQYNIGAVGVVRSNHFGAAGLYARMAAEEGLIGVVMSNVKPNIVAPGGSKPISGNNPLAIGIPTYGEFPFVLDISLSNVAGGKLLLASKKGEKIPLDWATDKDGRPTSDPDTAFAGFLLPLGGHKGLGLSYVVDLLAGVITGGAFQFDIKSMYQYPDDPSLTCHFMIVINPRILMAEDELAARMQAYVQTIKKSPMWDESEQMLLPGEIEFRTAQRRQKEGLPLPAQLLIELRALGEEMGVPVTI